MKTKTLFLLSFILTIAVPRAEEAAWPQWRGPLGNGVIPNGKPVTEWSEGKNVKWKIDLAGSGSATPIVIGEKIFLLTASGTGKKAEVKKEADSGTAEGQTGPGNREGRARPGGDRPRGVREGDNADRGSRGERRRRRGGFGRGRKPDEIYRFSVVCLDRESGKTLWSKAVKEELPHEGHHRDHGYASASPVSDGKHLYASFGSRGLYCLDLDGNLKWNKDLGDMRISNGFGEGASPALSGDTLLIKWDHEGDSFIVALDKGTGDERWRKARNESTSWSTPFVVQHKGVTQVIANATGKVLSYNLKTGEIIWESSGMTRNVIPTPVSGDGVVYVTSGFRGAALQAIELDTKGKVSESNGLVWSHDEGAPYVPSPLLYQNRLYFFQGNDNRLSCFDAKTGKAHYARERVEGIRGVYASPIGVNDHIYLVGRRGTVVVLKSSDKMEVVATNILDDEFDACPVVVGGELFLRGKKSLYCIAAK